MPPLPKRKISSRRQGRRRASPSHHFKLVNWAMCKNCGKPKLPHVACAECGKN